MSRRCACASAAPTLLMMRERVLALHRPVQTPHDVGEQLAFEQLHHDEVRVAVAIEIEHADDVRMRQRLRLMELALQRSERVRAVLVVELQNLHRDVARRVRQDARDAGRALVHRAAAAATEDGQQLVAIAQHVLLPHFPRRVALRLRLARGLHLCAHLRAWADASLDRNRGGTAWDRRTAARHPQSAATRSRRGACASASRSCRASLRSDRAAARRSGWRSRIPAARCRPSACAPARRRCGRGAGTGRAARAHPRARPDCCGTRTERTPACPHGRSGRRHSRRASWRARGARRRRQQVPCLSTHS